MFRDDYQRIITNIISQTYFNLLKVYSSFYIQDRLIYKQKNSDPLLHNNPQNRLYTSY